jgi:hypothetical protein
MDATAVHVDEYPTVHVGAALGWLLITKHPNLFLILCALQVFDFYILNKMILIGAPHGCGKLGKLKNCDSRIEFN